MSVALVLFLPQEFYGSIRQVKTSPMKMNLVAKLVSYKPSLKYQVYIVHTVGQIRKMSIGDALAQVEFCEKKAANFVQMVNLLQS